MSESKPDNSRGREETFIISSRDNPVEMIFNRFTAYYTPFGFHTVDDEIQYHALPYRPEPGDELLLKSPWHVLLELYSGDHRMVVGLDLFGDIVLGRGESRPGRIILDLEPYGAKGLGVSREHVMLRPTTNKLFAIDQGSTNGTLINGLPSGRGLATALKDQDLINLGNLVLMLHVHSKPE